MPEMDERIMALLGEFSTQRDAIKDMIKEVEVLRGKVDLLFPERIDAITRRFLEDKVKTMVSFYNVLLDMRKEITKSIKDELDIRRRVESGDVDVNNIGELLDIRDIVSTIESFEKKKAKLQNTRIEENIGSLKELESHGIDIPGMKELRESGEGEY